VTPSQALWTYAGANHAALVHAVLVHAGLSLSALAIGCGLSIPLGIWTSRHPAGSSVVTVMTALRAIPSLAVLALVLPVLGLGTKPALVALTLLAIPPILINTDVGYRSVDRAAVEAALGMGMLREQILRRVETPLAAPVVLAGVRTAAVEVIASATLAAFIGGGGLGDLIVAGLQNDDIGELLAGAVCVALLALAAEALLGFTQRRLTAPALANA